MRFDIVEAIDDDDVRCSTSQRTRSMAFRVLCEIIRNRYPSSVRTFTKYAASTTRGTLVARDRKRPGEHFSTETPRNALATLPSIRLASTATSQPPLRKPYPLPHPETEVTTLVDVETLCTEVKLRCQEFVLFAAVEPERRHLIQTSVALSRNYLTTVIPLVIA